MNTTRSSVKLICDVHLWCTPVMYIRDVHHQRTVTTNTTKAHQKGIPVLMTFTVCIIRNGIPTFV